MNHPQKIEKTEVKEVSSLLIPLAGRHILVPAVAVAEIVPYRTPERDPEAPDWYLGDITWRKQRTPLISYEVLSGEPTPPANATCRIAILNNAGVDDSLPFLGIVTQGIPHLLRIKPDELQALEDTPTQRFDLLHAVYNSDPVVIPDVTAVEQTFLDYRRSMGSESLI